MMFLIAGLVVGLDQWTKSLAVELLKGTAGRSVFGSWFRLEYVENRGAAFGILHDQRLFFIALTGLVVIGIIVYWMRHRNTSRFLDVALGLLLGGALGNGVDRLLNGFVVDFLRLDFFPFYDFPVFNIADIGVTVSCALLLFYFLYWEPRHPVKEDEHERSHRK